MITMKEVADLAGVSTATVSRTLMNPDMVSVKTREKVQAAVVATGYDARLSSRIKHRYQARIILVIASEISDLFFNKIIEGIENVASQNGYLVLVSDSSEEEIRKNVISNFVFNKQIAGLILLDSHIPFSLNDDKEHILPPTIMICEHAVGVDVPMVHIDNLTAAYEAVNFLIEKGHQRIATITGPEEEGLASYRLKGYEQALKRSGLSKEDAYVVSGNYSFESGKDAVKKLLRLPRRPTAIFCHNDQMAIGAMKEVRDQGLRVPEDISLVGFDGLEIGEYTTPPLTTIKQPRLELGRKATEVILEMIKTGKNAPNSILMESSWVTGGTVADLTKFRL